MVKSMIGYNRELTLLQHFAEADLRGVDCLALLDGYIEERPDRLLSKRFKKWIKQLHSGEHTAKEVKEAAKLAKDNAKRYYPVMPCRI